MILVKDKGIEKLSCSYSKPHNQIYIQIHKPNPLYPKFEKGVYVPVPRSQGLNMKLIENYQNDFASNQTITLAICDSSSVIIYYNLSQRFDNKVFMK